MISKSLLPEFDHEMATTRTVLELVRDEDAEWQPHEKSFSMANLAQHIANLPKWALLALNATEYDMDPPEGSNDPPSTYESTSALLEGFDTNVQAARDAIESTSDEGFMVGWTLKSGGRELFTQPRVGIIRSFVMNHIYHHRGQLTVYLRLRDIPLPMVYGPTADTPT